MTRPWQNVARALATALAFSAAALGTTAVPAANLDQLEHSVFSERDGESLYRAICQACHMADGKGAEGAGRYPALADNPNLASAAYVARHVLHGSGGMPALGAALDDAQVAAVVNYVRSHFGNRFDAELTVEEVRAERARGD